jgi:hypothetical protein
MRAGLSSRARPSPTDGCFDAIAVRITLFPRSLCSGRDGGVRGDSAIF